MSVVDVKESHSGRDSGYDDTSSSATRIFTVTFDVPASTIEAEMAVDPNTNLRVPRFSEPHPIDSRRIVLRAQARQIGGSPYLFEVRVHYMATVAPGENPQDPNDINPVDRPSEVSFGWRSTNEDVDTDVNNNPIRTTAMETVRLTVPRYDPVLRFVKNLSSFPTYQFWEYSDTINDDGFLGGGDYWQWLLMPFTGKSVDDVKWDRYYRVSFECIHRNMVEDHSGWDRRWLNEGMLERNPRANPPDRLKYIPIRLDGIIVNRPIQLDGEGRADPNGEPIWRHTRIKEQKPWGAWLNGILMGD